MHYLYQPEVRAVKVLLVKAKVVYVSAAVSEELFPTSSEGDETPT